MSISTHQYVFQEVHIYCSKYTTYDRQYHQRIQTTKKIKHKQFKYELIQNKQLQVPIHD